MARRRTSVRKVIRRQRIRSRRGRATVPQRVGGFLALTAKIFCVLLILSSLAVGGFALYRFTLVSGYFELKKLVITGVSDGIAAELRALTQLEPDQGINLLGMRADRIRETVLKHPRIESATVLKRYPNALIIRAREREPVAVVACGALYLVDREGYVLDTAANLDHNQRRFPFITGIDSDQIIFGEPIPTRMVCLALDVVECLRATSPRLAEQLSEIRIGRDEALTLVLSGGIEVRLGTDEFTDRLAALDLFARKHRNFETLEYIDLRFENQIVYRPRPG
ncbi:hypothetical protein AMJ85_00890 [candidate division BRC1 bacterium SM23_51]|nr:MAG: hypothetical protein AMJ85_00890 [candidate division BRC1 bacterium SM23_51]